MITYAQIILITCQTDFAYMNTISFIAACPDLTMHGFWREAQLDKTFHHKLGLCIKAVLGGRPKSLPFSSPTGVVTAGPNGAGEQQGLWSSPK